MKRDIVRLISAVVSEQPQRCNSGFVLRETYSSRGVMPQTIDWYPEYVPEHFRNLNNSSLDRASDKTRRAAS